MFLKRVTLFLALAGSAAVGENAGIGSIGENAATAPVSESAENASIGENARTTSANSVILPLGLALPKRSKIHSKLQTVFKEESDPMVLNLWATIALSLKGQFGDCENLARACKSQTPLPQLSRLFETLKCPGPNLCLKSAENLLKREVSDPEEVVDALHVILSSKQAQDIIDDVQPWLKFLHDWSLQLSETPADHLQRISLSTAIILLQQHGGDIPGARKSLKDTLLLLSNPQVLQAALRESADQERLKFGMARLYNILDPKVESKVFNRAVALMAHDLVDKVGTGALKKHQKSLRTLGLINERTPILSLLQTSEGDSVFLRLDYVLEKTNTGLEKDISCPECGDAWTLEVEEGSGAYLKKIRPAALPGVQIGKIASVKLGQVVPDRPETSEGIPPRIIAYEGDEWRQAGNDSLTLKDNGEIFIVTPAVRGATKDDMKVVNSNQASSRIVFGEILGFDIGRLTSAELNKRDVVGAGNRLILRRPDGQSMDVSLTAPIPAQRHVHREPGYLVERDGKWALDIDLNYSFEDDEFPSSPVLLSTVLGAISLIVPPFYAYKFYKYVGGDETPKCKRARTVLARIHLLASAFGLSSLVGSLLTYWLYGNLMSYSKIAVPMLLGVMGLMYSNDLFLIPSSSKKDE